jgi:hypothetical protein
MLTQVYQQSANAAHHHRHHHHTDHVIHACVARPNGHLNTQVPLAPARPSKANRDRRPKQVPSQPQPPAATAMHHACDHSAQQVEVLQSKQENYVCTSYSLLRQCVDISETPKLF